MDKPGTRTDGRGEEARRQLIEAGLEVFGLYSFEGATTRMLADRAGVNLAAIPYYFGGKEGLYRAVIEHVATRIGEHMRPVAAEVMAALRRPDVPPAELLDHLNALLDRFAQLLVGSDEPEAWARIIIREQTHPTEAFDALYEGRMRHFHTLICELVGRLLGRPADDPEVLIRAFTLMGQVLIFRVAREAVLRRLGTQHLDDTQVDAIRAVIRQQTTQLYASATGEA